MKSKNQLGLASTALFITLLTTFSGCSSSATNHESSPASQDPGLPLDSSDAILNEIDSPSFANDCVTTLQSFESALSVTKSAQLVEKGPILAKALWRIRLALHDNLPNVSVDCVREIKNTERLLRSAEDYLIERQPSSADSVQPYQSFYRRGTSSSFQFKDGDILLVRGNDFLSSLLSRIGDHGAQFSQMIFVRIDPSTKEMIGISSFIGPGAKIFDVRKTVLENTLDNVRVLILRGKDQDLAIRTSDFIFKRLGSELSGGREVPFDYRLSSDDDSVFTGPEIAEFGYKTVSNGNFILPKHPTHFSEQTWLTKAMGLAPGNIFNVGDIEVDPRFDLIGEWRNPRLTEASRRKDVVIESILQWIKKEGYSLHGKPRMTSVTDQGQWPFFAKAPGSSVFPKKIPRKILYPSTELASVAHILFTELTKRDLAFKNANSYPMSTSELRAALENFKTSDFEVWKNRKTRSRSRLHYFFRAD